MILYTITQWQRDQRDAIHVCMDRRDNLKNTKEKFENDKTHHPTNAATQTAWPW